MCCKQYYFRWSNLCDLDCTFSVFKYVSPFNKKYFLPLFCFTIKTDFINPKQSNYKSENVVLNLSESPLMNRHYRPYRRRATDKRKDSFLPWAYIFYQTLAIQ